MVVVGIDGCLLVAMESTQTLCHLFETLATVGDDDSDDEDDESVDLARAINDHWTISSWMKDYILKKDV